MKNASVIDHAARAAADGVERAGAAAVGELHADAEHEGADHQRRPERRDRAAETRHQLGDRNDRSGRNGDQQQAAEKPVGLAAHDQPPPRRGEAELGLEEHRRPAQSRARSAPRPRAGRRSAPARSAPRRPAPRRSGTASRGAAGAPQRGLRWQQCAHGFVSLDRSCGAAQEPKPSAFFTSSQRVRDEATGRRASAVHSTIEPS